MDQATSRVRGADPRPLDIGGLEPGAFDAPRAFTPGNIIFEAGPNAECHLILDGLVSIRFGEHAIGVDLLGEGELLNVGAVLGTNENHHYAVAVTDCRTACISAGRLQDVIARRPRLSQSLLRYVQERMVQSMQSAHCHLCHSAEQRLASWLYVATELVGSPEIAITHKALAEILGVRRPTVTVALQILEGERAIWSKRGRVIIRDRELLLRGACGCARARTHGARQQSRRLPLTYRPR